MAVHLHDGRRCSMCERVFTDDQLFIGMPAVLEFCSLWDEHGQPVQVYVCLDCSKVEEH